MGHKCQSAALTAKVLDNAGICYQVNERFDLEEIIEVNLGTVEEAKIWFICSSEHNIVRVRMIVAIAHSEEDRTRLRIKRDELNPELYCVHYELQGDILFLSFDTPETLKEAAFDAVIYEVIERYRFCIERYQTEIAACIESSEH